MGGPTRHLLTPREALVSRHTCKQAAQSVGEIFYVFPHVYSQPVPFHFPLSLTQTGAGYRVMCLQVYLLMLYMFICWTCYFLAVLQAMWPSFQADITARPLSPSSGMSLLPLSSSLSFSLHLKGSFPAGPTLNCHLRFSQKTAQNMFSNTDLSSTGIGVDNLTLTVF